MVGVRLTAAMAVFLAHPVLSDAADGKGPVVHGSFGAQTQRDLRYGARAL